MKLRTLNEIIQTVSVGKYKEGKFVEYHPGHQTVDPDELREEAKKHIKIGEDLTFKAPEIKTQRELELTNAIPWIKWFFNLEGKNEKIKNIEGL